MEEMKKTGFWRLLEDGEWAQWSDREIARRTATSAPFVASLRPTVNIYSGEMRRGGDGRVMNTANIGAKPAPKTTFESAFPAAMFCGCRPLPAVARTSPPPRPRLPLHPRQRTRRRRR